MGGLPGPFAGSAPLLTAAWLAEATGLCAACSPTFHEAPAPGRPLEAEGRYAPRPGSPQDVSGCRWVGCGGGVDLG